MKKIIFAAVLSFVLTASLSAQVINFAKTLPVKAFSLTLSPIYNSVDRNVYHPELRGMSYIVMAGYGLNYDVDLGVKYGYYNGINLFAADVQYLFRETRKSYYSFYGGMHKWEEYGLDLTVSFTYMPEYWLNFSTGLDIDTDISAFELRAWVPLNVGLNFDDRFYVFLEYDLPANERSWDMIGGGVTFIFR